MKSQCGQSLAHDEQETFSQLIDILEARLQGTPTHGESRYFRTAELPGPITEAIDRALEEYFTTGSGPWSWFSHMSVTFVGDILVFGA